MAPCHMSDTVTSAQGQQPSKSDLKPGQGLRMSTASKRNSRMAKTNPFQFMQQVRAETAKVTWPTRREVLVTTVMVFIMATLTAIFFFLVDLLIRTGLGGLLGMFN